MDGEIITALKDIPTTAPPMIEVRGLSKSFKKSLAIDNISFKVQRGEAFGFIGPNGAGKTTTIRILATLLDPTQGEAFIDGVPVMDDPDTVRRIMGYMPDYFGIYNGMKLHEYLEFFASAYRKAPSLRKGLVNDVLEITDLGHKRDTLIETLSKGMRQRLCIAKTLLHDPSVLILDEPASGLDPRARIELKELLKELNRMGKTIFISSHILPELSDICDTIGIIEAGKLLAYGSVENFTEDIKAGTLRTLRIRSLLPVETLAEAVSGREHVLQVEQVRGSLAVQFSGGAPDMARLLEDLVREDYKIVEFSEKDTGLEDVFMKITKGVVV